MVLGMAPRRLSKNAWLRHGLLTLAGEGHHGLKVGAMAAGLGVSRGSYSGPPASLGPLPDVCPDDPRKLPEALFRYSHPEATEPPVACEVQERLIEAIVAKAPARRTHTSVAAPMVAMAPRAGGGGEGGRLAAALARCLRCMNLLCVLFAAATNTLQARRRSQGEACSASPGGSSRRRQLFASVLSHVRARQCPTSRLTVRPSDLAGQVVCATSGPRPPGPGSDICKSSGRPSSRYICGWRWRFSC
jgi:hypothetical protein